MVERDVARIAIQPPHEVRDHDKLATLAAGMQRDGWQGRPLLLLASGDGWTALTGSHRWAAAKAARLDTIPALCIEDADLDADQWEEIERIHTWEDDDKMIWLDEAGLTEAADLLRAEIAANLAANAAEV